MTKRIKIENFDGTRASFHNWRRKLHAEACQASPALADILKTTPTTYAAEEAKYNNKKDEWEEALKELEGVLIKNMPVSVLTELELLGITTAIEMWREIEARYTSKDEGIAAKYLKEIIDTRMKPGESLDSYLARMLSSEQNYKIASKSTIPEAQMLEYLAGGLLPEWQIWAFGAISTQGMNKKKFIDLARIIESRIPKPEQKDPAIEKGMAMEEEEKRRPRNDKEPRKPTTDDRACYQCKKKGHLKKDCWFNPESKNYRKPRQGQEEKANQSKGYAFGAQTQEETQGRNSLWEEIDRQTEPDNDRNIGNGAIQD